MLQRPGLLVPLICAAASVQRLLPELEQDMAPSFEALSAATVTITCSETKASDAGVCASMCVCM